LNKLDQNVIKMYRYLHNQAEISWEEVKTTQYVEKILRENGCEVTTFHNCTGVIGKYGNFSKGLPVVALRADMDALWQEVDGVFQANHSCGHDAHMAIVLGVLLALETHPHLKESIAIKFIFQPAEEAGTGALTMIEKNVLEDVDFLFGIHLRPIQEMKMGYASPVIEHGATRDIQAEIIGNDAHAARPHLTHNAIEIGSQIVTMIGQIHLNPNTPHSIKMTKFHAGGQSTNIIPGNAKFALDLRTQSNRLMDDLETKVKQIFEAIRNLYNVEVKITNSSYVPAAETNVEATSLMNEAIIHVLGEERTIPRLVTTGGDDFHFYTIKKPSLKATMLGLGCDLKPGLHHPHMTFNENALINGVQILLQCLMNVYESG